MLLRLGEDDHLFLWTLHHAVSDGWSSILFLRELKALYESELTGAQADLPRPELQFADFSEWEREWIDGDAVAKQLGYWTEKLRGAPTSVLELPADHRRPAVVSYRGRCRPLSLSGTLVDGLRTLAQEAGVTLYTALLTGFKILLSRQTGQMDICVGSPIARRNRPELESVVGCFVNTLVLRTDLSDDPSVFELLARVRTTRTEALAHQDVPIEKLIEELQPPRDTGHAPLFQVMFTLHVQDSRKVSSIGDVAIEAVEYHAPTSKFDLTLELKETADGLEGWFEYSTDLFDPSTIDRLVPQFTTLLEGMVAAPETGTSKLPLLPAEERQRVLVDWNRTGHDYPNEPVHDLFTAQAGRTPNQVAVEMGGRQLTYSELDRRSNQVARVLRSLGVEKDVRVGLCTERSVDMLTALLGIMKAGGAYVPLDPSFPADRLSFMAEDAGLSVLVTESGLRERIPTRDAAVLELDGDRSQIDGEEHSALDGVSSPGDLAYVIYTSGSTGQPKGVQIEHGALVNFLWSMKAEPGLDHEDRLLAVTTLSFDIAGLELYLPLICGGTVVLASGEEAADGERLARLISTSGATVLQATPSTWRMLMDVGWDGAGGGLKILCGGEALPKDLADRLLLCGKEVWNLYGPTETTIWSTAHRVEAGDDRVFVGRPIANTTLFLLDESGEPVPTGVPAELFIGGDGVARGYLDREALTAERFTPSPLDGGLGGRLYRTGDLARYHADGKLEVMGRLDHQVKIRGFRIELGEIEAVLSGHPGIRQVVVAPRTYGAGDERLVAYLVPETNAADADAPGADALRAHAKSKLPDYMLPAAYVELEQLPLTPNGKIDRQNLPQPSTSRPELEVASVAPRTPTEEMVAGIWADVLGVDQVGVHDSFFDLGGHSLLMTKVSSRLADSLGVQLSLISIFERPTVAGLTEHILGQQLSQGGDDDLSRMLDELERS
ncbi:MAG: non-ribosomal peptide synthetase, partial [Longimicrobiales bacterium]